MEKYRFIYILLIIGWAFSCQTDNDIITEIEPDLSDTTDINIVPNHRFVLDFLAIDSGLINTINVFDNDTLDDRFGYKINPHLSEITTDFFICSSYISLDIMKVENFENGKIEVTASYPTEAPLCLSFIGNDVPILYRLKNSNKDWEICPNGSQIAVELY